MRYLHSVSQSTGPGVLHSPAAKRPLLPQSEGARVRHKGMFLEGLVGIFQEQLHPAGEFHSQPCCPGLRLRRGYSGSLQFCPAPSPCLQSLSQGGPHYILSLFAVECERPKGPPQDPGTEQCWAHRWSSSDPSSLPGALSFLHPTSPSIFPACPQGHPWTSQHDGSYDLGREGT